jgi:hypothetical protein
MTSYDNSYEARIRRMKGFVIAAAHVANPAAAIEGPRARDASVLTASLAGRGSYIVQTRGGVKIESRGSNDCGLPIP